MKIVHVNTSEQWGGAALAANRIHKALLASGIDSQMAVIRKTSDNPSVHAILSEEEEHERRVRWGVTRKMVFEKYPDYDKNIIFSPQISHSSTYRKINELKADIIHLHWIAEEFISIAGLAGLKAPVVWTLHDTWAFTGGCHAFKCKKFKKECGSCPLLRSDNPLDMSHISFKQKENAYKKMQATIVASSKHLQEDIKSSTLLGLNKIKHIPHCLDMDFFSSEMKNINDIRKNLSVPENSRVVLFGASDPDIDKLKGYDLLVEALEKLKKMGEENIFCLVFGANKNLPLPYPSKDLGYLGQEFLPFIYSCADVFVCSSRAESFSNTTLESLSCGTPVVGFDIGGIPDMVEHLVSGYVAKPEDATDLAKGMQYVLADEERRKKMGLSARKMVEKQYSMTGVAKEYITLYEEVLQNKKKI